MANAITLWLDFEHLISEDVFDEFDNCYSVANI
jgi:hypothetical protein